MYSETEDVIRALAESAESVCRHYLPAGRREGSYWIVGDLQNNPGRSLFVRLTGPASGPGAAGKFTDGATGEHGDLLDIIRERTGISRFPDLLAEARAHLGRPQPVVPDRPVQGKAKAPGGTPAAAARLFAASVPVAGTLADTYLRSRGLTQGSMMSALRFHPKCWHRDEGQTRSTTRPAADTPRSPMGRACAKACIAPGSRLTVRGKSAGRDAAAGHGSPPRQCRQADPA